MEKIELSQELLPSRGEQRAPDPEDIKKRLKEMLDQGVVGPVSMPTVPPSEQPVSASSQPVAVPEQKQKSQLQLTAEQFKKFIVYLKERNINVEEKNGQVQLSTAHIAHLQDFMKMEGIKQEIPVQKQQTSSPAPAPPAGQVQVHACAALELIKMFYSESVHQNPWKYNGREGRLKKLEEIKEKFKIAYETAKFMTDEEKKTSDVNILNKHIPAFFLSYFGEDVSEHISYVIGTYRELFGWYINEVNQKANVNKQESMEKKQKKIIFISDRLSSLSSVLKDRALVIIKTAEDKEKFVVDVMTKTSEDEIGKRVLEKVRKVHRFSGDIKKDIDTLIEEKYDIIVYCDCHMSDQASALSLFRLAPFQFSTWGHSETTGTADGYFVNNFYEIDDIKEWSKHYLEKTLFVQDSLGTTYCRPISQEIKDQFVQRDGFLLPKSKKLYLCTSSLFKMGNEMFEIFKRVLKADPNGIIVITRMGNPMDNDFYRDLETAVGDVIDRIVMLERQPPHRVSNLCNLADVYLESYPFGNLNSTMECFDVGLPVISWSSEKMNGRFTRGFYRRMGLENEGLLVNNVDDYVNMAVKVANDEKLNKYLKTKIKARSEFLFGDSLTYLEWRDILYNYCSTGDNSGFSTKIRVYDNTENSTEYRLNKTN